MLEQERRMAFSSQRLQEGFAFGCKPLSEKWILAAFVNSITLFCLNPSSKIQQKSLFTREVQLGEPYYTYHPTRTPLIPRRPSCSQCPTTAVPRPQVRVRLPCDARSREAPCTVFSALFMVEIRLEKRSDFRVPLFVVLSSTLITPPVRCILEKRDPVGDAEIPEP